MICRPISVSALALLELSTKLSVCHRRKSDRLVLYSTYSTVLQVRILISQHRVCNTLFGYMNSILIKVNFMKCAIYVLQFIVSIAHFVTMQFRKFPSFPISQNTSPVHTFVYLSVIPLWFLRSLRENSGPCSLSRHRHVDQVHLQTKGNHYLHSVQRVIPASCRSCSNKI